MHPDADARDAVRVLCTGGAGFLGRGILAAIERGDLDFDITVLSRDESKHIRVRERFPFARIIRGDVTEDVDQLARIFTGHDMVIHAGANKLIDIGEYNAREVVRNNVIGSEHVADAAMRASVKRVVGISTDKAVQPANVYGASKMIMERIFQNADEQSSTEFTCARYGNVVGSTISVVLYFRDQLAKDGAIQLTDPNMTRFYMGVDEAIEAIQAAMACERGSIVIPKMHGMRLPDVARIALGLQPDEPLPDDKVRVVGPRAGEKIHESLLHMQESVRVKPNFGIEGRSDEDARYFELRPVGVTLRDVPFEIMSDKPPLGWMPFDRMLALIEEAQHV